MKLEYAKEKCARFHQEHLLDCYDSLDSAEQEALLSQIEETDFNVLSRLEQNIEEEKTGKITPITAMTIEEIAANKEQYVKTGLEAIREGKIGAVLLAGGMGTRLGSENPKGMYD
ncbi:MAG: UTP--glucose-1-phosphate uridylyltransferase, partial [Clostridiaceae bacterium]|nr:UTP--glucose-1-phosphate uridylyltransferase [Clostridiaceae bacterium]